MGGEHDIIWEDYYWMLKQELIHALEHQDWELVSEIIEKKMPDLLRETVRRVRWKKR